MNTVGQAYDVAVEIYQKLGGEEGALMASESAELCRREGDEAGAHYWEHVTAFVTHLHKPASETVH